MTFWWMVLAVALGVLAADIAKMLIGRISK